MNTAPVGRNTELVSPAPCTPISTSTPFTSLANSPTSTLNGGSPITTSNPTRSASATTASTFTSFRGCRREMIIIRGFAFSFSSPSAPVSFTGASRGREKISRRNLVNSGMECPMGSRAGSMLKSLCMRIPTTAPGKHRTRSSLSMSTISYRDSRPRMVRYLPTYHGWMFSTTSCTSPPNRTAWRYSGIRMSLKSCQ
uniref:Uncharacterized protein n=2 Tax=Arundo donax TaxID=35708 RepID=A0A0A9CJF7_ARUDO